MRIIHNRLIPFKRYDAINLFGVLFCRRGTSITTDLIQHECIHTAQMVEMGFAGFYLWYAGEWVVRLFMHGRAYTHISLEREAYAHMHDPNYLVHRRHYAWWAYIRKEKRI